MGIFTVAIMNNLSNVTYKNQKKLLFHMGLLQNKCISKFVTLLTAEK